MSLPASVVRKSEAVKALSLQGALMQQHTALAKLIAEGCSDRRTRRLLLQRSA